MFVLPWGLGKAPGGLPFCEMQRSFGRGLVESGKKAVKAPA